MQSPVNIFYILKVKQLKDAVNMTRLEKTNNFFFLLKVWLKLAPSLFQDEKKRALKKAQTNKQVVLYLQICRSPHSETWSDLFRSHIYITCQYLFLEKQRTINGEIQVEQSVKSWCKGIPATVKHRHTFL